MRVLSGRLKAVIVASIATCILVGILGPATTLAGEPTGLPSFMRAVAHFESGGDYSARNPISGAYGKYQILPSNWMAWARQYLGDASAKPTPANQETVAAAKMSALFRWLGSWRRVAYWWLTGSDASSGWTASATRYVNRLMDFYAGLVSSAKVTDRPTAAKAKAKPKPKIRHYPEGSPSIAYAGGTWRSARFVRYAGGAVRYATTAGASATLAFTGRAVVWYGPVGPTRGKARILVDGVAVRTVDLHRGSFSPRVALFARSWSSPGSHTLTIVVLGTPGHKLVAIDELVVTG